ncbi:MAG TPA: hypothetical protein PLV92_10830, partial [Pirellulaceae bacterium]|nr:hypothetical protein [Pirellulaceae bacterium]
VGKSPRTPQSQSNNSANDGSLAEVAVITTPDEPTHYPPQLRDLILRELEESVGLTIREMAERLQQRDDCELSPKYSLTELTRQIQAAVQDLHGEERLQATPTSDDIYLLLLP